MWRLVCEIASLSMFYLGPGGCLPACCFECWEPIGFVWATKSIRRGPGRPYRGLGRPQDMGV